MRRGLIVGIVIVAAVGLGVGLWMRPRPLPADPLDVAPRGSVLVGHLALSEVLASPFWREVVQAAPGLGTQRMAVRCGFDPADRLRGIDVFVPGAEDVSLSHVGVLARGAVRSEDMVECLQRLVRDEGASLDRVELEGAPALVTGGGNVIAFVGPDGAVAGAREVAVSVLHVVTKGAPSARQDAELADFYETLAQAGRHLTVAAILPSHWRAKVDGLLASRGLDAASGVRAIGVAAEVDQHLRAELIARAGSETAASAFASALSAYKENLASRPFVSLTIVGTALRAVRVAHEGADLHIRAELRGDQLGGLLDLWKAAARSGGADGARP